MAVDASTQLQTYSLFIGGENVPAASGETFDTVSPTTNEAIGRMAKAGVEDVERAVAAARKAFDEGPWPRMAPLERSRILHRVANILRERLPEIARIETMNCGKIIVESRGDVTASANCFEYYAGLATQLWGEQIPMNGPLLDYTLREPVGVCAQIVPWNFPLLMAAWKLAPALAAGNTLILKPASATPITAIMLGEICREAGVPDGVVNVLTGPGKEVGEALAAHPRSTRSPSPARRRPDAASSSSRRGRSRRSRSSWAARARTSSSPMPISTRRSMAPSSPSSPTPGSAAQPAPASSCTRTSTTSS